MDEGFDTSFDDVSSDVSDIGSFDDVSDIGSFDDVSDAGSFDDAADIVNVMDEAMDAGSFEDSEDFDTSIPDTSEDTASVMDAAASDVDSIAEPEIEDLPAETEAEDFTDGTDELPSELSELEPDTSDAAPSELEELMNDVEPESADVEETVMEEGETYDIPHDELSELEPDTSDAAPSELEELMNDVEPEIPETDAGISDTEELPAEAAVTDVPENAETEQSHFGAGRGPDAYETAPEILENPSRYETVGEYAPRQSGNPEAWDMSEVPSFEEHIKEDFDGSDTKSDISSQDDGTDWERTSLTPEQEQQLREMEETGEIEKTEVKSEWVEPIKETEHLPTKNTGLFSGEPGNSTFRPFDQDALEKMAEYGKDTVEYKNNHPDFSPFAKHQAEFGELDTVVEIGHMTDARKNPSWEMGRRPAGTSHDPNYDLGNFAQAENELLRRFPEGSTIDDVQAFVKNNNLTWHEVDDGKTMMLVPKEIHDACRHSGGVSEMKYRMAYGDETLPTDDF